MRIVCRVALGLEAPPTINRILNRFEAATGYLANIVSYAKPLWKSNGPMSLGAITEWYVKRIDAEIYPLIAQEKRRFASVNRNNTQCDTAAPQAESNKSVLQQLVELQSVHGYDDAFIRDNLVAILAAGYDTSGSALSWMIYWLCRETGQFELLTEAQQQGNSKALDSFRDEVLRYCPPIEILPRRIDPAKQEEARTLIGGLNAITDPSRPDPMVCPFIHRIHHNPDIYDEPEVFKADRFQGSQTFNNNEFLPFGAGHRMCIGLNLGKGILDRTLAAMIEQRLKLETRQILFKPIRRNVSIWPGHSLRATIVND